jgi:hypothetical protein
MAHMRLGPVVPLYAQDRAFLAVNGEKHQKIVPFLSCILARFLLNTIGFLPDS